MSFVNKVTRGTFPASYPITEDHYMGRYVHPDIMNRIKKRYDELTAEGVPEPEKERTIMSEFAYGSHFGNPWPPRGTGGYDTVDRIYQNLIPAEAYPPKLEIYEQVAIPDSLNSVAVGSKKESHNWLGLSASTIGGPVMHGEEPAANKRQMPEESFYPWKHVQEQEPPKWARFVYANQENCPICQMFDGMIFDISKYEGRPVVPSEHKLYTSTHPNCKCRYELIDPILYEDVTPSVLPADRRDHISHINRIIGQKARHGTLHPLKDDGSVFEEFTINFNPRHIMETVTELREQFKWLSPEYIQKIHAMNTQGKFLLIRAAAETITDHRIEGEPYRRLLTGLELYAMARTAIGKGMDINHNPEWRTPAVVIDSEGDIERKEIQMLVYETDPEILNAIADNTITAVSINGGAPRQSNVECGQTECFLVPKGVILGELDGIALTYVVTNPQGFRWRGQWIPPAEPGVKTTKIEIL